MEPRGLGTSWGESLGLSATPQGPKGTRDGFRYRIFPVAGAGDVLWCTHRRRLRLGLAVQPIPVGDLIDRFPGLPYLELGPTGIGACVRARAAEGATARAILLGLQDDFAPLLDLNPRLFMDDRRIGVALSYTLRASQAPSWVAAQLAHVSTRLVETRQDWEAGFETAIEPAWHRVAEICAMRWSPDRSMIRGKLHGASVEARIDANGMLLYTEIYVEWPSLERALSVRRPAPRGTPLLDAEAEGDDAVKAAFDRSFHASADALPARAMAAALRIARTGASLEVDDTGLVTRLDRVVDDEDTLSAMLLGAIEITSALLGPATEVRGAYR